MRKICYIVTISGTIEAFFIPQLKYLSEHGFDVYVICSPNKIENKETFGDYEEDVLMMMYDSVVIRKRNELAGELA